MSTVAANSNTSGRPQPIKIDGESKTTPWNSDSPRTPGKNLAGEPDSPRTPEKKPRGFGESKNKNVTNPPNQT